MLNNANLGDTTLSSAKIQLINAAESRQSGITRNYVLDDVDCDNLKSIKESVSQCLQIIDLALNEGDELTLAGAKDGIVTSKTHVTAAMNLIKVITEKIEPTASNGDSSGPQTSIRIKSKKLPIHFEDAVNVLRSLQHSSSASNTSLNQGDIEKIVQRALVASNRGAATHLGGPSKSKQSVKALFSRDSRKGNCGVKKTAERGRRRNPLNPRTEEFCKDCGSKKHVRGDQSCENPSFYTLRLRESRERDDRRSNKRESEKNDEGSGSPHGKFFHSGSSHKRV